MKGFRDKVIFNMATFPARINSMRETVQHILPQCDYLNIYLNNFEHVPEFLIHDKIRVTRSQDCAKYCSGENNDGDLGDVGKFWNWAYEENCYFFTVDDKFAYPPDYAEKMIAAIEKYNRKAIVSLHGRIFHDRKITSYYYDCKYFLGCLSNVPEDTWVHELGTGVMAFHTDTIKPKFNIFTHSNMTDILFSAYAQQLEIPLLVLNHTELYLRIILKHDTRIGISVMNNKRDGKITEIANSFKWKINKVG